MSSLERAGLAAVLAIALLTLSPAAHASTTASLVPVDRMNVEWDDGHDPTYVRLTTVDRFTVTTAPGERNDITVDYQPAQGFAIVTDAAAGVVAGPGCALVADSVRCAVPDSGDHVMQAASIDLGDGDDRMSWRGDLWDGHALGLPWLDQLTVVRGGPGADEIDTGVFSMGAEGGPGDDVMTTRTVSYADRSVPISYSDDGIANDGEPGEHDRVIPGSYSPSSPLPVRVVGGSAGDTITAEEADGGPGDDLLAVSRTADGGKGDDVISAHDPGSGDLRLYGGPGDDRLTGGSGSDQLDGGLGADVVRGGAGGGDGVAYVGTRLPVTVTLDDRPGDGRPGENDDIGSDVERVIGGDGDDHLVGNDGPQMLHGGSGGRDVLEGLGGDDELYAFGTGGHVIGGAGRDTVGAMPGVRIDIRDGERDTVLCRFGTLGPPTLSLLVRDRDDVVEICQHQPQGRLGPGPLRLDHDRRTRVRVFCSDQGGTCNGALRLSVPGHGTLGRAPFSMRPGTSRRIIVRLGPRALRILRRTRHSRVVVEARIDGSVKPAPRRTMTLLTGA